MPVATEALAILWNTYGLVGVVVWIGISLAFYVPVEQESEE